MGTAENYDEVLKGKYPAKAHAKRVAEWIVEKGGDRKGTIYLEAQKQRLLEVCFVWSRDGWSGNEMRGRC
jgi:Xaa-Pro dipeptidase